MEKGSRLDAGLRTGRSGTLAAVNLDPATPPLLLVEDDEGDATLTVELLQLHAPGLRVHVVRDVPEALNATRREAPSLVLHSLCLGHSGGLVLLAALRADPATRHVPIVVLSASHDDPLMWSTYREHANALLVKPLDATLFDRMIEALVKFWFGSARRSPVRQSS